MEEFADDDLVEAQTRAQFEHHWEVGGASLAGQIAPKEVLHTPEIQIELQCLDHFEGLSGDLRVSCILR